MNAKFPKGEKSVSGVSARFVDRITGDEYFVTALTPESLSDIVESNLGVSLDESRAGKTTLALAE